MLWNACRLTGPFERRCRVYVFRYGKKVIELAKEKLTPKLCQTFGLCDKVQMLQGMYLLPTWPGVNHFEIDYVTITIKIIA